MIDQIGTPYGVQDLNVQTYYNQGGTTTTDWQTWIKPRNARMVQIFCLGAGAGGCLLYTSPSPRDA